MTLFRLFTFLIWCTTLKTTLSARADKPSLKLEYMKSLNGTLHGLELLMSFYEEQIDQVNLDAIYGLRVAEGALVVSLAEHDEHFWASSKAIHQKVSMLRQQSGSINNRAQASIKGQSREYYDNFKDVVDKPWTYFKEFGTRKLPKSKVKPIKISPEDQWDEEISDRCMSEALGSNPNQTECMFSPLCVKAITDHNQEGYGPTHQILFLTAGLMHNCDEKYSKILKQQLGINVDGLVEDRCVRILSEMLKLESPHVATAQRDLYMEQAFVCGLHGYEEFLSIKRLQNILSWQRSVGCFGKYEGDDDNGDDDDDDDEDDDDEDDEGDIGVQEAEDNKKRSTFRDKFEEKNGDDDEQKGTLMDNVVRDYKHIDGQFGDGTERRRDVASFRSMRRLLVDVTVGHGCSAHESGVAVGLLGLYTKWLLAKVDSGKKRPTTGQPDSSVTHQSSVRTIRSITGNNNPTKANINEESKRNSNPYNVTAKDIYIRAMVIAAVTSLLTVAVVLSIYKLGEYLCCGLNITRRKYRPLIDA